MVHGAGSKFLSLAAHAERNEDTISKRARFEHCFRSSFEALIQFGSCYQRRKLQRKDNYVLGITGVRAYAVLCIDGLCSFGAGEFSGRFKLEDYLLVEAALSIDNSQGRRCILQSASTF